jgi:tryptophan 7-halogenase
MSTVRDRQVRKVVIVGGGSAGWITAGLLASEHAQGPGAELEVVLIESPDVNIIGVGEGTWPTMRSTLRRMGLSESDFINTCSASLKQGTRFRGWTNGAADDIYYHPFSVPAGYPNVNSVPCWLKYRDRISFAHQMTPQARVCDQNLAPKQAQTPEYAHVLNYGYHLDAGKFAMMLAEHCTRSLGVKHIVDHVNAINGGPDADIRSLATERHGDIEADLFIDCTGMASLLLGRHYQVPFIDRKDILFNDAALAVQIPHDDPTGPIASQTNSTAQAAGWVWDIALSSRRGTGYVYSSQHSSDEQAEQVLRHYLKQTSRVDADAASLRKLSFRPGYRQQFWHRNCLAIGMSGGFIEPLEASALVMVELAAAQLTDELPANRSAMDIAAKRFNTRFTYRWERIIDFLKLHYVLSRREDSPYWADNRQPETIPDSLTELLELWRFQVPSPRDFSQVDEVFSAASYQYVLYGMGFETRPRIGTSITADRDKASALFAENERMASRLLAQLPTNRSLLGAVAKQGLPKHDARHRNPAPVPKVNPA